MWRSRDPIPTFTTYLQERRRADARTARRTSRQRIRQEIDEAVAFAENSPDPDPAEAVTDIYA